MLRRLTVLALCAGLLAACGFQLRGVESVEHIEPLYVGAERDSEILETLRRNLELAGVDVLDAPDDAAWRLTLHEEREEQRTVSVTDRGLAADIELSLAVRFGLEDERGRILLEPRWTSVERTFRQDPDNLAGSSREREMLRSEMGTELAQRILRSLNALRDGAASEGQDAAAAG